MNKKISTGLLVAAGVIYLLTRLTTGVPKRPYVAPSPSETSTYALEGKTGQRTSTQSASGSGFDFYLLNLSWSPEFCYTHPTAAECASHPAFVLHGLWPENQDGTYPENCSNAPGPADPAEYKDIYPDQSLLAHEWQTHGTCSGLSADEFFSAARSAFRAVKIPPTLSGLRSRTSMPPEQVLDLFAASNPTLSRASMALSCGNNYLTAVEICVDKGLHPIACGAVRSCRANAVRVVPPGE
jgi:ribonuclease T2